MQTYAGPPPLTRAALCVGTLHGLGECVCDATSCRAATWLLLTGVAWAADWIGSLALWLAALGALRPGEGRPGEVTAVLAWLVWSLALVGSGAVEPTADTATSWFAWLTPLGVAAVSRSRGALRAVVGAFLALRVLRLAAAPVGEMVLGLASAGSAAGAGWYMVAGSRAGGRRGGGL